MQKLDFVIVGGGIVGLAIGAALSPHGSVAVLERRARLIEETSSRNSGVVHAGIYYPPDSLKTRLCVEGNANMWRLQKRFPAQMRARQVGKWIGACQPDEDTIIEQLARNMEARGLPFRMVPEAEMAAKEPLLRMTTILESTSTGIVDVHALRDFFVRTIESSPKGGYVACQSELVRLAVAPCLATSSPNAGMRAVVLETDADPSQPESHFTIQVEKAVIVASGLHVNGLWSRLRLGEHDDQDAPSLAMPPQHKLVFCKGRYAACRGKPPLSRLVYPCPAPNLVGLGVHSVVDMDGQVRFGPDAIYVDDPTDLRVASTPEEEQAFLDGQWAAIRRYLPSLDRSRLALDFAGIRPKLAGPGEPFRDFLIEELTAVDETSPQKHVPTMTPLTGAFANRAAPRLVVLNGIESPGLTASTALGDFVCRSLVEPRCIAASPSPWSRDVN